MSTPCSGRKRSLCLWSTSCGPGSPMPLLQVASFLCFLHARSSEKLCHCDLSLQARAGGLWTPTCWSGTLLHVRVLGTVCIFICVSALLSRFHRKQPLRGCTHRSPLPGCFFLELDGGIACVHTCMYVCGQAAPIPTLPLPGSGWWNSQRSLGPHSGVGMPRTDTSPTEPLWSTAEMQHTGLK